MSQQRQPRRFAADALLRIPPPRPRRLHILGKIIEKQDLLCWHTGRLLGSFESMLQTTLVNQSTRISSGDSQQASEIGAGNPGVKPDQHIAKIEVNETQVDCHVTPIRGQLARATVLESVDFDTRPRSACHCESVIR